MIEMHTDIATERQVDLLADLLDHTTPPWRPGVLPPLAHWLLFPPRARQALIGADGHPCRAAGGLIPDNDLPRRMWAGSRVRFVADVPLGKIVTRETTLAASAPKSGRSGRMLFATLAHRYFVDGLLAIEEDQDLVFREAPAPGSPARPAAPDTPTPIPPRHRTLSVDPVALFRFSALTHNGHRIHYDRDYAIGVEQYPGLVVHGPFLASLLLDHYLLTFPAAPVTGFSFRAMRPVFDGDRFTLGLTPREDGGDLVVIDGTGAIAVSATVAA